MKKYIISIIGIVVIALLALAESYRQTSADLYRESYRAQMRRMGLSSAADIRSEHQRELYENEGQICDEDHNCVNVAEEAQKRMSGRSGVKPVRTVFPVHAS